MKTRLLLASMLAGAACATAFAGSEHENERFLHRYEDLIRIVGEGNAEATTKIRLSALYREAGATAEADRLLAEAAAENPELNTLLNPAAQTDYAEFLAQHQARVANGGVDAGADVIVGDLNGSGPGNYTSGGPVSGKLAFSIGTTSCNLGTVPLEWIELSSRHPVIAQNFYRLHNGRFEHIGMSWLKHGFCALQQNICGSCSPYGSCCCDHLGLLCSDPYEASLNGSQSRLGPRNEVNPAAGTYPWPHYLRNNSGGSTVAKRLQVTPADMNTTTYSGAVWIGEGQYVALDDANAGNRNNNASYRRFNPTWNGTTVTAISWSGSTQRQKAAIEAWRDFDPTVEISTVDIPGDGRLIVANKVTDNGNGTFTYEYAVQNLNSHRAVQAFSVPAPGVTVSSAGFHDVDYHTGDGVVNGTTQDGTDWASTTDGGSVSWATQTITENPNANALKWSTLYNFRFTANRGPSATNATLTLFRPGTPTSVTAAIRGPACLLAGDVNGDNMVDFADLNIVLANFGTIYTFQDLNNVLAEFGQTC